MEILEPTLKVGEGFFRLPFGLALFRWLTGSDRSPVNDFLEFQSDERWPAA
jgi:hypothetical protein